MKTLIFAGAGASVELGVPAMSAMMKQLVELLESRAIAPAVLLEVRAAMESGDYDIEQFIEMLDGIATMSRSVVGGRVDPELRQEAQVLRSESEWFVQHACERVVGASSTLLWGPTLAAFRGRELCIATTNYDRAIEMAALGCGVPIHDGFAPFGDKEWSSLGGNEDGPGVRLLKLHGSTDWYRAQNTDDVLKLRHPMPLFGGVSLKLDSLPHEALRSAVVLPSREKRKTEMPFVDLWPAFFNVAREADLAVFIGASLRDPDVRRRAADCGTRGAVFVVGPTCPDVVTSMAPSPLFISQTASEFLMSTLPAALLSENPIERLLAAVGDPSEIRPRRSVLRLVETASDGREDVRRRCDALDALAAAEVALPASLVAPLIESPDAAVRTFALALIPRSPQRDELLGLSREAVDSENDPRFAREVEMLTDLLERGVLA